VYYDVHTCISIVMHMVSSEIDPSGDIAVS